MAALPLLSKDGYVLILYGDQPFIQPVTLEKILHIAKEFNPTLIQSTIVLPHFEGWYSVFFAFGRIVRNAMGELEKIVEYKNASNAERALTEVNPGLLAVKASWLHQALVRIQPNEVNQELYLTDLVSIAKEDGVKIETITLEAFEALGINSPEDAQLALEVISNACSV